MAREALVRQAATPLVILALAIAVYFSDHLAPGRGAHVLAPVVFVLFLAGWFVYTRAGRGPEP